MPYKLENAKVLVVDDMPPMLALTKSLLNIFGFKDVFTASDGEKAFDLFCKHSPDLVITDWMMEPMDGLTLIEKIRKDPFSPDRYVPVIIMTGFSSKIRVETARDEGITEFLVKPFTANDLYARIERVVEKPRQFVDSDDFFGPDRRRRKRDDYGGPLRRDEDESVDGGARNKKPETPSERQAADTLRRLIAETRKRTK